MRRTAQRQMVADALSAIHAHPTCEDVCLHIRKRYQGISLGTVYRILGQMNEKGEIRRIPVPGEADRFDKNAMAHYHVKCALCGAFSDVETSCRPEIDNIVELATGYALNQGQDIVFKGKCPDCRQNELQIKPNGGT